MLPAEKKISLYHVEDEDDWQSVVESVVKSSTTLEYIPLESNIRQLVTEFRIAPGPGIAVFDLRLEGVQSELHTIVELSRVIKTLNHRKFDVFVLSGHLPEFGRPKLLEYGIPNSHIFNKGTEFDRRRNEFIRLLQSSESKLRGVNVEESRNNGHNHLPPICEVEVQLTGVDEANSRVLLGVDQECELKILVKSFPDAQQVPITNRDLQIVFYGDSFLVSPKSTTLHIPDPGEIEYKICKFRFNKHTSHNIPRAIILIYHANHLIQQFTIDFQIS